MYLKIKFKTNHKFFYLFLNKNDNHLHKWLIPVFCNIPIVSGTVCILRGFLDLCGFIIIFKKGTLISH